MFPSGSLLLDSSVAEWYVESMVCCTGCLLLHVDPEKEPTSFKDVSDSQTHTT